MISMICGASLVDRVSTDVVWDRVGVGVKIEGMIIQTRLLWYGHIIRRDINSQIREVVELEITVKRKKAQPRKSWKKCVKKDLERYGLRIEDAYDRKLNGESKLKQKLPTSASRDNDSKGTLLCCCCLVKLGKDFFRKILSPLLLSLYC